mgnify:CR=1 FL=1
MIRLTEQQVLAVHSRMIEMTGGSDGVRDRSLCYSKPQFDKFVLGVLKFNTIQLKENQHDMNSTYTCSSVNSKIIPPQTFTPRFIFRGHSNIEYKLLPSIFREESINSR